MDIIVIDMYWFALRRRLGYARFAEKLFNGDNILILDEADAFPVTDTVKIRYNYKTGSPLKIIGMDDEFRRMIEKIFRKASSSGERKEVDLGDIRYVSYVYKQSLPDEDIKMIRDFAKNYIQKGRSYRS